MALIESRRCPACGRTSWQEYVPQLASASSYWRCRDCGNRRQAERITIEENALLGRSRLQADRLCADVHLVDICRRGVRVRCGQRVLAALSMEQHVLFNPQLQPFGELARFLPGVVRWMKEKECGICFTCPLSLAAADIRCILKR